MRTITTFYVIFVLSLIPVTAQAESDDSVESVHPADSTVHAWLPFLRFDSDIGIVAGGLWNRYYYIDDITPFGNITEGRAQVSSKGRILGRFAHERVNFMDGPFRIRGEVLIERLLSDNYFGSGNDTELDETFWEDGWYNYESWASELTLRLRYPFPGRTDAARMDLLMLGGMLFYQAYEKDDQPSLLFEDYDPVNDKPLVTYIGTGIVRDHRDNEFDTRSGTYAELEWLGFPGFLTVSENGSSFFRLRTDLRAFYSIRQLDDLTFAGRIGSEWVAGDAPFWMLPILGGEETMRGFHLRRFRDQAMVHYSLALRKWLVSLPFLNMRLGLQAFTDNGRVFGNGDSFSDLLKDHHRTAGGGLLISAFTSDFIIRADYAVSEETGRMYINIGFVY